MQVETRLAEAQVSLSVKQQQTYKQEQDNTLNARVSAEQQVHALPKVLPNISL